MYFSFRGERKVPKERPSSESPTVPPLRTPPEQRTHFAFRKMCCLRVWSSKPRNPHERRSAVRAELSPLFQPKVIFSLMG